MTSGRQRKQDSWTGGGAGESASGDQEEKSEVLSPELGCAAVGSHREPSRSSGAPKPGNHL